MREREIFLEALEQGSPDERRSFLDRACGDDTQLRSRLELLLKSHEEADSLLDHPVLGDGPTDVMTGSTDGSEPQPSEDDTIVLDFLEPSEQPDSLGRLGQYEIREVVGRGGMGIVFKAHDTKLSRVVAVKVLAPELAANATARKRFLREARAAAAVSHDHVVTIYAVEENEPSKDSRPGTRGAPPFLVMEFIDGLSLQDKIERVGTLQIREILRIGSQIASGLAAAHGQGLIHRDVKPSNVLLENGVERVKITDFGLARAVDDIGMTRTGEVAGTPEFMSPEQAQGLAVEHRSDLFSLGTVLYAMCTGRSPFRADTTVAVLRRVCDDVPRPIREINPEIPESLVAIIDRLLAKNPDERLQTSQEVADLLGRHLAYLQHPTNTPPPGPLGVAGDKPMVSPQSRPRRRLWAVAGLILLALLAGLSVTEATGVTRMAATVIRIATGEGTLVIEVDDPTVKILIDGEDVSISGAGVKELRLRPGEYQFRAIRNGKPIKKELVTISRGGRHLVKFTMESPVLSDAVSERMTPPQPWQELLEPGAPPPAVAPFDAKQAREHQQVWGKYLGVPVEKEVELPGEEKLTLVLIPPGEFVMGSPEAEQRLVINGVRLVYEDRARPHEKWLMEHVPDEVQHRVRITKSFYLGTYEVTQTQWEAVMGDNPSNFKYPTNPVNRVSWEDVQSFLAKLNTAYLEEGMEYVLPTEAQWEYACRAGTATAYCFGEDAQMLGEYGWCRDSSGRETHPVGEKMPNAWGLYDMHGNAWEWCADRYADDYYSQSPLDDPVGASVGENVVRRGGSTEATATSGYCRSASRARNARNYQNFTNGFRIALVLADSASE